MVVVVVRSLCPAAAVVQDAIAGQAKVRAAAATKVPTCRYFRLLLLLLLLGLSLLLWLRLRLCDPCGRAAHLLRHLQQHLRPRLRYRT
jgi:hypothetical protein